MKKDINERMKECGIELYKVRAWVLKDTRKGKEEVYRKDMTYIGNIHRAEQDYKEALNEVRGYAPLKGYTGTVELIIPHVFNDGNVAYWGEPLKRYEIGRGEYINNEK